MTSAEVIGSAQTLMQYVCGCKRYLWNSGANGQSGFATTFLNCDVHVGLDPNGTGFKPVFDKFAVLRRPDASDLGVAE